MERPELLQVDGKVDFYFDETSDKKKIIPYWDDYLAKRPNYRDKYGATPRFENDEEFLPLQAADFRAWWVRKWAVELGEANISQGVYPFPNVARPIYHLILTVDKPTLKNILAEALGEATIEVIKMQSKHE